MTVMEETWIDACGVADIPDGGMHHFKHNENWVVIYHVDGDFFATDNICPHAFALFSDGWLEDGLIECPLHGALFDIRTGEVKRGPAECAVNTFKTKVDGDRVLCAV
ncbi:non-heme iron oxygenase ferredoxin subunit [Rhizobium sp. 2YAF20]|uniref:non-heme iron oxygenase ferredoxin subunit n=1 Tax=Rhizobium sp. 2YAF20 TaxID=3233027 RepID=UPI003F95763B